jgi:large subunit ribosomal protein L10
VKFVPTKTQKEANVQELQSALSGSQIAIVADYRGLSVKELTDLRRRVQKTGGDVTIAKNTLIKVALKGQDQWKDLESLLKGPTALVTGGEDFIGAAKALNDFTKEKRAVQVKIRGAVLHGEAMTVAQVSDLASLPSREGLLTMIAQLLMSPITGFARGVNALVEKRGGAPAEAAPAAEAEAPAAEAPAAEAPAAEAPAAEAAEAPAAEAPGSEEAGA